MSKIAVLLLGFGGPECLADVGPFVEKVTGRATPPDRLAVTVDKYRTIGGGSPLREMAEAQGVLLEQLLRQQYSELTVYLGMRYWHPLNSETVKRIAKDRPETIVLFCLSPFYSYATSREYINDAIREIEAAGLGARVVLVEAWNTEKALIDGLAKVLRDAVLTADADADIIFTAHSLPQEMVDQGDPYVDQIAETVALTVKAAGIEGSRFGWQSAGHGRGEWLKPEVGEVFAEIKAGGGTDVIVMPIGFMTDHVETLYDVDIEMRKQAEGLGLLFSRACCLNKNGSIIEAMASAISRELNKTTGG